MELSMSFFDGADEALESNVFSGLGHFTPCGAAALQRIACGLDACGAKRIELLGKDAHARRAELAALFPDAALCGAPSERGADVVWAEGFAHPLALPDVLAQARERLRIGGTLVCGVMSYYTDRVSPGCRAYWEERGVRAGSIASDLRLAREGGFVPVSYCLNTERDWREGYYAIIARNLRRIRREWFGDEERMRFVSVYREEIAQYRRYGQEYAFVFYVFRKHEDL